MAQLWEKFQHENQFRFKKELLECNSCNQLLAPPVYLNADAGNICNSCKTNNSIECIRNEALTEVLFTADFPCKHAVKGCDKLLKHDQLLKHQLVCHYAPLKCPNCKKEGFSDIEDVIEHYKNAHEFNDGGSTSTIDINEYRPNVGGRVLLHKITIENNDFYVKIMQEEWNVLQLIICCPLGINLNQNLKIKIQHDFQEIYHMAKIVESWNMLNSMDNNYITTIYLTELQHTKFGDCENLQLHFIFNNNEEKLVFTDVVNFRKDIECPICFNYLTGQIYKCRNAHNVCNSCKSHITTCPVCREDMGHTRDIKLENILSQVMMFCINKDFGCLFESDLKHLREHELKCLYHQYACHVENCKYECMQLDLIKHYQASHRVHTNGTVLNVSLDNFESVNIIYMNHIFLLECSLQENNYVWRVSLINSTGLSWQYIYTIQILDKAGNELCTLNNSCGQGVSVDFNMIQYISKSEGNFDMKCYVRKLNVDC